MSFPVPLAVVGGGSIGLRHATQALEAKGVRLTAVVEPSDARRGTLADMGLPVAAALADLPTETRAVVVATPTQDHYPTARSALERGWSVLVEKPITATLDEGAKLCDAADAAGLPLFTGHHRRCHPFVAAAREMMPSLGPLVAVQGLWSLRKHDSYFDVPWRRAPGAGPLLTNLSHEIDLLRYFAGEVTEVTAQTSTSARGLVIEDTAAITFRFSSNALGTFLISDAGASPWSFESATAENPDIAPTGEDPVRFIGTKGAMSFPSLTLWSGAKDWRSAQTVTPGRVFQRIDPIRVQLERFARVVEGEPDGLLATGRDGLSTLAATLATLEAAETGRSVQLSEHPIGEQ